MNDALAGCRVLVTRERPGELAAMLEHRGAIAVHVPLIEVLDAPDDALERALAELDRFDWIVVTSAAGAERVGPTVAATPSVRLAAVGTATARTLEALGGRPVEVVPSEQRAAALLPALLDAAGTPPRRILVAHADRAASTMVEGLRSGGHDVTDVVAYRTALRRPAPECVDDADALLLASGSAAQAWFDAMGERTPPIVVAIGPTTADVAERLGLKVTGVAADHSLDGLVTELGRILLTVDPGARGDGQSGPHPCNTQV